MGSQYLIYRTPSPPLPPKKQCWNTGGILNRYQQRVGGGEEEVAKKTICWQKCEVSQDLTRNVVLLLSLLLAERTEHVITRTVFKFNERFFFFALLDDSRSIHCVICC